MGEHWTAVPSTFYPIQVAGNLVGHFPVYRSEQGRLAAFDRLEGEFCEVKNEGWLIRPPQEPPAQEAR